MNVEAMTTMTREELIEAGLPWRTAAGEDVRLVGRETSHVFNCLQMIHRHLSGRRDVYFLPVRNSRWYTSIGLFAIEHSRQFAIFGRCIAGVRSSRRRNGFLIQ